MRCDKKLQILLCYLSQYMDLPWT